MRSFARSPKTRAIATSSTSGPRRESSSRSTADRTGSGSRPTSRTCASTRSRSIHATTRCSSRHTVARCGSSTTSSRFKNTRARKAANADAKLFTPGTALQWKTKDERNDEFWGHQYFVGENPPNEAVVQYFVNKPVSDLKLRVSDAAGKTVRELTIPSAKMQAGIQTACWDMRMEPIAAPAGDSAAAVDAVVEAAVAVAAAAARRWRRRYAGGAWRSAACSDGIHRARIRVPMIRAAEVVAVVVVADSVLAAEDSAAPVRMRRPATYTVALVQGGKVIDSKPLKVGFDPDVRFAAGEHERYNAIVTDLHSIQRRGTEAAGALNKLYPQMADVAKKVSENASVPALVKTQFESLNKDLDALRKKFGVPLNAPAAAGRGGGGGGGRGGAVDPDNVLARTSGLKTQIAGIWETPSASMMRQYNEVKLALPKAVADANALLGRATGLSQSLKKYDITLNVPPTVK